MNDHYAVDKKAGNRNYRVMYLLKLSRALVVLTLVFWTLTGCLDEKRDRVTNYEPGVYKGYPDERLTQAQVNHLKFRAGNQSGP